MTTALLLLPNELIVQILLELGFKDVLACRLVCHALRDTVDGCVSLQYTIQLGLHALVDNLRCSVPPGEKLSTLRRYVAAWLGLSPPELPEAEFVMELSEEPAIDIVNGIFAQCKDAQLIEFKQLPSYVKGIPAGAWKTHPPCRVIDFTVDPSQDLLIVVAGRSVQSDEGGECIRILSMLTSHAHPLAMSSRLEYERKPGVTGQEVNARGQYVGLLLNDWDYSKMMVWDWRTGKSLYDENVSLLSSFTLLGDHHVLIVKTEIENDAAVNPALYLVDLTDPGHQWKFCLPPLRLDNNQGTARLLCTPGAMSSMPTAVAAPFYVSPEDSLVLLTLDVRWHGTVSFAFLSSDIITLAQRAGPATDGLKEVLWSDWGYHYCRASDASRWDGIPPLMSYGMMTAYIGPSFGGDSTGFALIVQDYNPKLIRHLSNLPEDDTQRIKSKVVAVETALDVLDQCITTSLPYREVVIAPWDFSEHAFVTLSEDSMIVMVEQGDEIELRSYSL